MRLGVAPFLPRPRKSPIRLQLLLESMNPPKAGTVAMLLTHLEQPFSMPDFVTLCLWTDLRKKRV